MDEGTSLDDLLNEPVAVTEPQEPETIGQPRDDHGRFASNQDTGVETPQEPAEAPVEPVPPTEQTGLPPDEYKALKDERRKRQDAEARIAVLEAQFQTAQQAQQPPEPEADFWDNPQGVIASQVQRAVLEALNAEKQQQQAKRIDESEASARAKYADYDDAFYAFRQAVQANPALAQQMAQASDPAEFAYTKGKTALELGRVGSIDELLKAERAKWEAEAKAAMPAPPALPSTTAIDGSVGGRSGPAWAGAAPLDDLLK